MTPSATATSARLASRSAREVPVIRTREAIVRRNGAIANLPIVVCGLAWLQTRILSLIDNVRNARLRTLGANIDRGYGVWPSARTRRPHHGGLQVITRSTSILISIVLGFCLSAAPAYAQLARTFVSSFGNDANDCSRAAPCRTFQRAHDGTLSQGEITVLDPAATAP